MNLLDKKNIFAWCIVPYDIKQRTPDERALMLHELEIQSYVYDWRPEHLNSMQDEMRTMKEQGINIRGIWFWMDQNDDEYFDENNKIIFDIVSSQKIKTDLWIGIPDNYLSGFSEKLKFDSIVKMIKYTYHKTKELNCTISLYNHGGWFGEPRNQLAIIDELKKDDIGIIYNFHHAHDQIDNFENNLILMKKYLRAVNINGMKKDGNKIIPVGQGDKELEMIKLLIKHNYTGPIGIIGHTENADVKDILAENLSGIDKIKKMI